MGLAGTWGRVVPLQAEGWGACALAPVVLLLLCRAGRRVSVHTNQQKKTPFEMKPAQTNQPPQKRK